MGSKVRKCLLISTGLTLGACGGTPGASGKISSPATTTAVEVSATTATTVSAQTTLPAEDREEQQIDSYGEIVEIIQDFEIPTQAISGDVEILLGEFNQWLTDLIYALSSPNDFEANAALDSIEPTRMDLHSRSIALSNTYLDELAPLKARLFALRVEDDSTKELRDITLQHFEAWKTCGPAQFAWFRHITGIAFDDPSIPLGSTWSELWTQSQDLVKGEPCQNVSPTFSELCITLGDLQPSDLSFKDTVIDICDD